MKKKKTRFEIVVGLLIVIALVAIILRGQISQTTTSKVVSLRCSLSAANSITCSWQNCPAEEEVTVALSTGNPKDVYSVTGKTSGSYTFSSLASGTYYGVLDCGDSQAISQKLVIS